LGEVVQSLRHQALEGLLTHAVQLYHS
jgi:hypothetical protein